MTRLENPVAFFISAFLSLGVYILILFILIFIGKQYSEISVRYYSKVNITLAEAQNSLEVDKVVLDPGEVALMEMDGLGGAGPSKFDPSSSLDFGDMFSGVSAPKQKVGDTKSVKDVYKEETEKREKNLASLRMKKKKEEVEKQINQLKKNADAIEDMKKNIESASLERKKIEDMIKTSLAAEKEASGQSQEEESEPKEELDDGSSQEMSEEELSRYDEWYREVNRIVSSGWDPVFYEESSASVVVTIDSNGKFVVRFFKKSSDIAAFNDRVIEFLVSLQSRKFPPPPNGGAVDIVLNLITKRSG